MKKRMASGLLACASLACMALPAGALAPVSGDGALLDPPYETEVRESYDPPPLYPVGEEEILAPPMVETEPLPGVAYDSYAVVEESVDYDAMTPEDWERQMEYGDIGIAVPNVEVSVDVARDFSLAYVTENANIYAPDKKTVLFTLAGGDSLLIKDQSSKTLSVWTAVLVIDNNGDYLAYVRTSKLARAKKNTLRVRDISKYQQYCVAANADNSYKIYASPSKHSAQVGTLRRAIVLPVTSIGEKYTRVLTYDGVGYIRNDHIAIVDNYSYGVVDVAAPPVEEAPVTSLKPVK